LLDTGLWQQGDRRTPESFLQWKVGLSPHRADAIVAAARERCHRPATYALLDEGRLSIEQLSATLRGPRWADTKIADFAPIATVTKIRLAMRSNMFEPDPDEPAPKPKPADDRLSFGPTDDGRWRITGNLPLEDGLRIEAAIAERKDAVFDRTGQPVTTARAFVDCFDRSLDAVESSSRRDHYRTWLHVDVTDGHTITTDGWQIPMAMRDHILCDGVVQPVWERDGIPFSVGRSQRIVPERTRRIIELRDRGCRTPGCTSTHVEIHHIIHWLDGGPTDTWNLISLCKYHHRLHHQGELEISGNADLFDQVEFTFTRNGRRCTGVAPPTPTTDPPANAPTYRPPLLGRF
ncbi:MAG: DUF222 domain-containing protein, partial [Ilumatobacter sp.]|nr:DUF222 domain-containing protein [Ilumatobacter sp.]